MYNYTYSLIFSLSPQKKRERENYNIILINSLNYEEKGC